MKTIDNYYKSQHQVLITLTGDISLKIDHERYYRRQGSKLLSYGYALNKKVICIVLNVDNDEDFEYIISNDPELLSGILEVDTIIPYH